MMDAAACNNPGMDQSGDNTKGSYVPQFDVAHKHHMPDRELLTSKSMELPRNEPEHAAEHESRESLLGK
jgi:hypothetical protein